MKQNVGKTDRAIRLLLALVIGLAGVYFKSWWGILCMVPLLTALTSFCPLYSILGINTCPAKKAA
jgi:hypothetical protein